MIAIGVCGNKSEGEDIVQQAITIALQKDNTFESEEQFGGWLAGIVRNCARNHRRKTVRRKTYATDPQDLRVASPETKQSPVNRSTGEMTLMQEAFDDRLKGALQKLDDKARTCLFLRTIEDLSYKEISKAMDIPEGTAMNLVHRTRQKLRTILSDNDMQREQLK